MAPRHCAHNIHIAPCHIAGHIESNDVDFTWNNDDHNLIIIVVVVVFLFDITTYHCYRIDAFEDLRFSRSSSRTFFNYRSSTGE